MYQNYQYDTINHAIPDLFGRMLKEGHIVPSRNGNTAELPMTSITLYDSTAREILVPGRKHNLAAQIAETMWVLSGRNDIKWLSDYLPRAVDYSDDGVTWRGGYGRRIRNFGPEGYEIDQLQHVVGLLRATPDTRQAVVSIYDPMFDTAPGKDIPCNDFLHFLGRDGVLDLHIFVRSNDMMWGWSGINVFEWSTLLEVVAGLAGMEPGAMHFSVSSFHLYETHWEKARGIADAGWAFPEGLKPSPRFDPTGLDVHSLHALCHQWFLIEAAIRKQAALPKDERNIYELIEGFSEPMMRSWLYVIAWWWTSDMKYLRSLIGTALFTSSTEAVQPLSRTTWTPTVVAQTLLIDEVITLHNEKDAAYGDSWCRRGEMLGIMANIARKIDRLGGLSTRDETSLDTATDLFVYLGKYRAWIDNGDRDVANAVLRTVAEKAAALEYTQEFLEGALRERFEGLEQAVMQQNTLAREKFIADMLADAWALVVLLAEAS